MTNDPSPAVATFMVRTSRGPRGRLCGVVERVRTGEKERFTSAGGLGRLIDRMLRSDDVPGRQSTRRTP